MQRRPTINKSSTRSKPATKFARKKLHLNEISPSKTDRELWALLANTDARSLRIAADKLERLTVNGIRHFSAIRRTVPLQLVDQVTREIWAFERKVDPSEVFSGKARRKWQRKAR